jgi:hypothetical protein
MIQTRILFRRWFRRGATVPAKTAMLRVVILLAAGLTAGLNSSHAGTGPFARYCVLTMSPASAKQRILKFPREYSLGELKIEPWDPYSKIPKSGGAARGTVVVPPLCKTTFQPAHRFYADPSQIKSLPQDGIDVLQLSASSVSDEEDDVCDRALAFIGRLKNLVELDLDRSDASDKGMGFAASLPDLQKISAALTLVEGRSLEKLSSCKHLRSIDFNCSSFKDENLKYLRAFPELEYLHIARCNVTDQGVKSLAGCNKLALLDLSNNSRLTDSCIPYLLTLKNLHFLILDGTSITSRAVMKLTPLPLVGVIVSADSMTPQEVAGIRKALPHARIEARKRAEPIDADTRAILAPLH